MDQRKGDFLGLNRFAVIFVFLLTIGVLGALGFLMVADQKVDINELDELDYIQEKIDDE